MWFHHYSSYADNYNEYVLWPSIQFPYPNMVLGPKHLVLLPRDVAWLSIPRVSKVWLMGQIWPTLTLHPASIVTLPSLWPSDSLETFSLTLWTQGMKASEAFPNQFKRLHAVAGAILKVSIAPNQSLLALQDPQSEPSGQCLLPVHSYLYLSYIYWCLHSFIHSLWVPESPANMLAQLPETPFSVLLKYCWLIDYFRSVKGTGGWMVWETTAIRNHRKSHLTLIFFLRLKNN